jgi:hypothetical protein
MALPSSLKLDDGDALCAIFAESELSLIVEDD